MFKRQNSKDQDMQKKAKMEGLGDCKKQVLENYWFDRVYFAGELGETNKYRHKRSGAIALHKTYTLNKKEELDEKMKSIKLWNKAEHPNIGKVLGFSFEEKRAYCSSFFVVDVIIEGFENTLADYIASLKKENFIASTDSLLKLMADIGEALAALKKFEFSYGCLSPEHIGIKEQRGEIIGATLIPLPGITETVYEISRRLIVSSTEFCVAPEIYDRSGQLFKNEVSQELDGFKIDAFCLGLSVMKTGTLETLTGLYSKKRFDRDFLKELIAYFKECYEDDGELLCECISLLLKVDPADRVNAYQLMLRIRGPEDSIDDFEIDELVEPDPKIVPRKIEHSQIMFRQLENPIMKPIPDDLAPRPKKQDFFYAVPVPAAKVPPRIEPLNRDTISLRELSNDHIFSSYSGTPDKIAEVSPPRVPNLQIDLNPARKKNSLPGKSNVLQPPIKPSRDVSDSRSSNQQSSLERKKSADKSSLASYRPLLKFDANGTFPAPRPKTQPFPQNGRIQKSIKDQLLKKGPEYEDAKSTQPPAKKEAVKDIIKSIIAKTGEMRSSKHKNVQFPGNMPQGSKKSLTKPAFFSGKSKNLFDESLLQRTLKLDLGISKTAREPQTFHRRSKTSESLELAKAIAKVSTNTWVAPQPLAVVRVNDFIDSRPKGNKPITYTHHERKNSEPLTKVSNYLFSKTQEATKPSEHLIRPSHNQQHIDLKNLLNNMKNSHFSTKIDSKKDHVKDNFEYLTKFNKTLPSYGTENFKPLIMPRDEYFGGQLKANFNEGNLKPSLSEGTFSSKPKYVKVVVPESLQHPEIISTGQVSVSSVALGTIKEIQPRTSHLVRECIKQFNEGSAEIRSRSSSAGMNRKPLGDNNQYSRPKMIEERSTIKARLERIYESLPTRAIIPQYSSMIEPSQAPEEKVNLNQSRQIISCYPQEVESFSSNPTPQDQGLPTATFNSIRDVDASRTQQLYCPSSQSFSDSTKQRVSPLQSLPEKEKSSPPNFLTFADNPQIGFTFDSDNQKHQYVHSELLPAQKESPIEAINNPLIQIADFDQEVADMKKTLPFYNTKKNSNTSVSRLAAFIDPRQANPLLRNKSLNKTVTPRQIDHSIRTNDGHIFSQIGTGQDSGVQIDSRSGSFMDLKSKGDKNTKIHTAAHSYFVGPRSGYPTREASPQDFGGLYKVGSSMSRDMSIREVSYHGDWKDKDASYLPYIEREGIDPLGLLTPSGFETRRVSIDPPKNEKKETRDDIHLRSGEIKPAQETARSSNIEAESYSTLRKDHKREKLTHRKITETEHEYSRDRINRSIHNSGGKSAFEQSMSGRKKIIVDIVEPIKPEIHLGVLQINYCSNGSGEKELAKQGSLQKFGKIQNYCSVGVQTEDTRDDILRQESSRGLYATGDQQTKLANYDSVGTLPRNEGLTRYDSLNRPSFSSYHKAADLISIQQERDTVEARPTPSPLDQELMGRHFGKKRASGMTTKDKEPKKSGERRGNTD